MPCYSPLKGYRSATPTVNGKFQIVFSPKDGLVDKPMEVPCGQCIGCRLERSRQWAIRCMHEASLYSDNSFITLTYSDEHLPTDMGLRLSDFQKFMKRLRFKYGSNIRFYHCGEYGDTTGRPHYHACLFNHDFPDKKFWTIRNGNRVYRSAELEKLWPFGLSEIGDVTFQSAAYVARYIMKKVNGDNADEHYTWFDRVTGEIVRRPSEYTTMSRRPGIGSGWFEKYKTDVYPHDRVIVKGQKMRPPRYYDRMYEIIAPDKLRDLKILRVKNAKKHLDDNTSARLNVREEHTRLTIKALVRSLD